jgi:hypothetical protein
LILCGDPKWWEWNLVIFFFYGDHTLAEHDRHAERAVKGQYSVEAKAEKDCVRLKSPDTKIRAPLRTPWESQKIVDDHALLL